ncbi:MAG: DHA2 family efflux MFS transporter permease subunit, partial [Pyrinomonadaceae bacterium]
MEIVDLSVLAVTLPKLSGDLGASPNEIVVVLTSYLVANAAIIPITGWLATYFGRKRYYLACVVGFTISSFLCGLAPNLEMLVLFRILQGISGGGLATSEQAIIANVTPPDHLGRVFSFYGACVMFASVIAPTLGGFITDTLGWRWIFFINIPIGVFSFFMTSVFVRDTEHHSDYEDGENSESVKSSEPRDVARIDWFGIALTLIGITALLIVLEEGPKESWFESGYIFFLTIVAAISLVFAVAWELVCENPAVDLSLLAHRGFAIACVLIFLASFVFTSGISIVIPVFVQDVLGFGAFETGLVGMPGAISVTIGVYVIGYMIDKFTAKYVIAFGYFASILAFLNMATLTSTFPFLLLIFNRTLVSISMTFGAVGVNATAYYGIDPKKHNAASSMLNLARILGTSFGYSVVATILVSLARRHIVDLGQNFSEL